MVLFQSTADRKFLLLVLLGFSVGEVTSLRFIDSKLVGPRERFGRSERVERPKTVAELRNIIVNSTGPFTVAGERYSMGGQTYCDRGTVIDMRRLGTIIAFDPVAKLITVQAGASWREVQEFLYPYNLSVMVMQSYNDFSVGGSLSVNVHGRDPHGQLITTVQSISVMLSDGSLMTASRTENSDLFSAALGGYGACGVLVDVTLRLEDNYAIKRILDIVTVDEFKDFYDTSIAHNDQVAFFNGNLYGPKFNKIVTFTWHKTNEPLTVVAFEQEQSTLKFPAKIVPSVLEYLMGEFSIAQHLRFMFESSLLKKSAPVVLRSYEMSYSVSSLALHVGNTSKILQEYFVPVNKFTAFVKSLKRVIKKRRVKVLNISVRHVPKNTESLLSYAPQDMFALVCYIALENTASAHEHAKRWTQELIDAVLSVGGSYYLPYHQFASPSQFRKAYPRYPEFLMVKQKYDPQGKFQSNFLRSL